MKLYRFAVATVIILTCLFYTSCDNLSDELVEQVTSDVNLDYEFEITSKTRDTLHFGSAEFNSEFNPFFVKNEADLKVVELSSVRLLTFDRAGHLIENAIDGATAEFNGELYNYYGVSEVDFQYLDDSKIEIFIKLKHGVKFSDGELLDIDDLIFTFYVLSDPSYDGPFEFASLPIMGLDEYVKGNSNKISGISRIDDTSLKLCLEQNDDDIFTKLDIFIAPMHHYGCSDKYNYEKSSFGFEKGNIETVKSKILMGAGAYKFVSNDENSVYLTGNEHYFKGIPNIDNIIFKEMDEPELISSVCNGYIDIAEIYLDDDIAYELDQSIKEVGEFLLSTFIYHNKFDKQTAIVVNSPSVDKTMLSGDYTAFYSIIDEIYLIELSAGL